MILLLMMTYLGAALGGLSAYAATKSLLWLMAGVFAGSTMAVLAGAGLLHRSRGIEPGRSSGLRAAPTNL